VDVVERLVLDDKNLNAVLSVILLLLTAFLGLILKFQQLIVRQFKD